MNNEHILLASPVRKNPEILQEFLFSLSNLQHGKHRLSFCLTDDNEQSLSSRLLTNFANNLEGTALLPPPITPAHRTATDHYWDSAATARITAIKNAMIEYFLAGPYDRLFFLDADILLQPPTLLSLIDSDKDIVSAIYWTKWEENSRPLPQVWLKDFYTMYDAHMLRPLTPLQMKEETEAFLQKLLIPGLYRVGGLGACTMIRRKVLQAGVNFSSLYNLSFWGEDRSFCVRAVAAGFELYVNTHYPAFHIYRAEDLQKLPDWHKKPVLP